MFRIMCSNQRGYAFVKFRKLEEAENAIRSLNDKIVCNSRVEITRSTSTRKTAGEMRRRHLQYGLSPSITQ